MENHDVEFDYAGFRGHPRLTCHTCQETLLKQPYTKLEDWIDKVKHFAEIHPSEVAEHYKKLIVSAP